MHNCGIDIHRVERVIEYVLTLDGEPLDEQQRLGCADVLVRGGVTPVVFDKNP